MNDIETQPTTLFGLLMLGDEPLAELMEERERDTTSRFAFCRRLGATLREAREAQRLTTEEVAMSSGTSPRLLRLIEAGALDENWIADETIEALAEALELDPDALYEPTPEARLPPVQWDVLVERFRTWLSGSFETRFPVALALRGSTPHVLPSRSFGRGLSISPIGGRLDAVVLQVSADALGELAKGPLLVVLQDGQGTILAEHVFDRVTGTERVELSTDSRAATANDVVMILARKRKNE